MASLSKINSSLDGDGEKPDRVRRACDRCNTSRTRCTGGLPWYVLSLYTELNYPCQYERTVKKRGPKPRSAQKQSQAKPRDEARRIKDTSPTSTISSDSLYSDSAEDRGLLTPSAMSKLPVDSDFDMLEGTQSPLSVSDVDSCFSSVYPLAYQVPWDYHVAHIPTHDLLSLDSSGVEFGNKHNASPEIPPCRYPCLNAVVPFLRGTLSAEDACQLLEIFFADPVTSIGVERCPYVLSPVIRSKSLLSATNPRSVSPALLVIILWCVSHTANLDTFLPTGSRARVTQRLYILSMKLLNARGTVNRKTDSRIFTVESNDTPQVTVRETDPTILSDAAHEPNVDDVLSYVLLTCVISGTGFKDECLQWWNKAVSLVRRLGLHSEARISQNTPSSQQMGLTAREDHEERRRVFWLVYALDRHLALSFDEPLHISDSEIQVLSPLPEWIWQNLDTVPLEDIPPRVCGAPTQITGTGFYEYFLPLMAILGDIIELRSLNQHPRLGSCHESHQTSTIETMLAGCEYSLEILQAVGTPNHRGFADDYRLILPTSSSSFGDPADVAWKCAHQTDAVVAYSQYIVQVLHILLRGHHTTASLLETSKISRPPTTPSNFFACTPDAVAATGAISRIMELDADLSFMPFLFGVYLFHGSSSFLSLADQMACAGADELAKAGCEAIARANELSVTVLDTPFQRNLSRALRQYSYLTEGSTTTGTLGGSGCDFIKVEPGFDLISC
ncbi:fungal-specific transcription factor domain-containing protein [Aspergillus karnatakaensis]|uniref:Zn(II)2Cys6 transcription factor n=1 Tax=Aspergillus karnatakaensis TaxID=1810916 RepID=UPI003CCDC030